MKGYHRNEFRTIRTARGYRRKRSHRGRVLFLFTILFMAWIAREWIPAIAQPRPVAPDSDYLFIEDKEKKEKNDKASVEEKALKKKKKEFDSLAKGGKLPFDVNANQINFDSTGNKLLADGGLIIKYSSMVLEAMKGVVDLTTNEVLVSGDVRISDLSGTVTADSARINLDAGVGKMENAEVYFSAGEFQLKGKEITRQPGDVYTLTDGTLTTCQCAEGKDCPPWRIRANEATVRRNGYGEAWGAKLDVLNVPVFYTPYLIFPAKTERQTGLLPFTFGRGRQSGFDLEVPLFINIDDSTDMTVKGVYESNVRFGADTEFRKVFSRKSEMEAGIIYFNEGARDGDLLGTDTTGLDDPEIDDNRYAGYIDQNWKGSAGDVPLQFITRGKYLGDDLFLREYENDNLGQYNSRFATSRMTFRAPISSSFSLDLLGEYNQSLVESDDFIFQRLPEAQLTGINVFKPFGDNALGLKLVSTTNASAVDFVREKSYDGTRAELYEGLKFPFHVKNYFDASLEATGRATQYNLDETRDINEDRPNDPNPDELKSSSDRFVPGINYKMDTALEKVFDLDEDNWIREIGELGTIGRNQQLSRVKHTLEPGLRYKFVPDVDQSDNPQFDALDQLAQKNVVTYQLVQRLYGRYEPRNNYLYGIEEATPDASSLGNLRTSSPLDDAMMFGFEGDSYDDDFQRLRVGSLRELVTFKLSQSYEFNDPDEEDTVNSSDVEQRQLSDVGADLILYPNDYAYVRTKADFDSEDQEFSAYLIETQLEDKRGDRVRARFRDVQDQVRQLEGNLELKITDSFRLGYYARYDDLDGEFLETKVGMRYISQCNCWMFDLNFADRINPDETKVTFNITLIGLGELNQHFFPGYNQRQQQRTSSGS